jgi:HK97 family phage prohead protease
VSDIERRQYRKVDAPELRAKGDNRTISGAAAVFNQTSQNLGGFVEQIAPGAFTRTLQTADVVALFNHDPSQILGRTSAGNLSLSETDLGLMYEVTVPATRAGLDAAENVRAGLVTGSSFAFRALADTWSETDTGYPLRMVTEAALYDVGPVTFPAYLQTEQGDAALAVRSFCIAHDIDPADIPSLVSDFRDLLTPAELEEITSDEVRTADADPEVEETAPPTSTLSTYRARLVIAEIIHRSGL